MKTFILILTLFLSTLLADEKPIIKEILSYPTDDTTLSIQNIKKHDQHFKKPDERSSQDKQKWIKVTLADNLKSGTYIVTYGFSDFDLSSFTPKQQMKKFQLHGGKNLSFIYDKNRDSKVYYLHILPTDINYPSYAFAQSEEKFYENIDDTFIYLLLAGFVLGLIMMTAIYNASLYYYNKEKSLLYYALMQICMVGVLSLNTGMPQSISSYFLYHPLVYDYLSLFTALFAILFARSFLSTKKYLPIHDKVLLLFLVFIVMDMLYYPMSIFDKYGLYSITTLYFIVVGFLRIKQGYKPAIFFFFGWIALTAGIMIVEHFPTIAYFDTMLLGSTIEAIMLALALAYKIKQIQDEKEQQKELLIHQSKLASMGEMIGNIAHQWRQPLTNLSYILMNIEELDDKKQRSKKVSEGTVQLEFMSQTIDDFKNFYAPTKAKEEFDIVEQIEEVLKLMQLENIHVVFEKTSSFKVYNYKNEFKQVLLNLLTNAKEALIEKKILNPSITIKIDKNTISIDDNAGGIKEKDLQKVFEPYFTTKDKSSGIGLYMSKMIVEKNMDGRLSVQNSKNGASFTILLTS